MSLPRLAVLVSGSGTNLQALIDAVAGSRLPVEIVLVVSDRQQAYGLQRAARAGIAAQYFPFAPYKEKGKSREDYDTDLAELVATHGPDLIVLAGFMRILSPAFLDRFPGRVINLHPALPGQFPGTRAIERAYAAYQDGEIEGSGCMVHLAIPEVDAGQVIALREVPILPSDSLADFEVRMHAAEHEIIVEAANRMLARISATHRTEAT